MPLRKIVFGNGDWEVSILCVSRELSGLVARITFMNVFGQLCKIVFRCAMEEPAIKPLGVKNLFPWVLFLKKK